MFPLKIQNKTAIRMTDIGFNRIKKTDQSPQRRQKMLSTFMRGSPANGQLFDRMLQLSI